MTLVPLRWIQMPIETPEAEISPSWHTLCSTPIDSDVASPDDMPGRGALARGGAGEKRPPLTNLIAEDRNAAKPMGPGGNHEPELASALPIAIEYDDDAEKTEKTSTMMAESEATRASSRRKAGPVSAAWVRASQ